LAPAEAFTKQVLREPMDVSAGGRHAQSRSRQRQLVAPESVGSILKAAAPAA